MENKDKKLDSSVKNYVAHNNAQARQTAFSARVNRAFKKSWAWIKSRNLATVTNVALLCLAVAMLVVLVKVVQQNNAIVSNMNKPTPASVKRVAQAKIVSAKVPAQVSVNTKTGKTAIVLPMKKVINQVNSTKPQKASVNTKKTISNAEWLRQEDAMRPAAKVRRLPAMSEINGNLYVQNMNSYTIPCGTKVRGDMVVRNVRKLNFCGCFEVKGNIYVGKGTSFGPMPKNAKIGGQIIY